MLFPKLDQIARHAESACADIERSSVYTDRNSPFHADAVSMYNSLATISITAEKLLKEHFPHYMEDRSA
jgi:hypothetical protein